LAEQLETSVRTIYRYVDALCASGVPILADAGPDGGYSLPDRFRSAPLFFESDELVALFQAALLARVADHPYPDALARALDKVRHNLGPEQAEQLERRTAALAVVAARRGGPVAQWLPMLEAAVANGTTLSMQYQKPEDESPEERQFDPYGLAYRYGLWYVVGHCHLRNAMREFRVDRIRGLTPTAMKFQRPANFQMEGYYSDEWVQQQVRTQPHTRVVLTGTAYVLSAVAEHTYLRYCVVEQKPKALTLQVDPWARNHLLPSFLLSLGTRITILEPADLRVDVAHLARLWAEHHQPAEKP
ncbi:MAG: helix-turn-helix transcriptional regulator, partial [Mycobacterium leprae]